MALFGELALEEATDLS